MMRSTSYNVRCKSQNTPAQAGNGRRKAVDWKHRLTVGTGVFGPGGSPIAGLLTCIFLVADGEIGPSAGQSGPNGPTLVRASPGQFLKNWPGWLMLVQAGQTQSSLQRIRSFPIN